MIRQQIKTLTKPLCWLGTEIVDLKKSCHSHHIPYGVSLETCHTSSTKFNSNLNFGSNVNPNFKYYHFVCQQYLELIRRQCVNTYKTTPVLYFYFAKPLAIDV